MKGLKDNGKFDTYGDIDFGTNKFIVEAKSNLTNSSKITDLQNQLKKYMPQFESIEPKYFNPFHKQVVVVCDKLDETSKIIKELKNKDVIFVKRNKITTLYK